MNRIYISNTRRRYPSIAVETSNVRQQVLAQNPHHVRPLWACILPQREINTIFTRSLSGIYGHTTRQTHTKDDDFNIAFDGVDASATHAPMLHLSSTNIDDELAAA